MSESTSEARRVPGYETFLPGDAGWCPNNPACPVIVYHHVHEGEGQELAAWLEQCFASNGWPPAWRFTIYDYAHYHSNTHEVVGVYRGTAEVRLGDRGGQEVSLKPGDVVIIPAGVSHQRISASRDFVAVGAYPEGFSPDQVRQGQDREKAEERLAKVPLPEIDPVAGRAGVLRKLWQK